MSRLDSVIRRLEAQRACLNAAVGWIADLPGPIFELGLGNGRTYDHLRELFPERQILVFDRQIAAHPDCVPDDENLFLGDIEKTLPDAAQYFGGQVALLHTDIGTGHQDANAKIAGFIASQLPLLMKKGGYVIADQAMPFAGSQEVAPPAGVRPGRYFLYRAGG